jgi:plasmid stabilization system protein ParE
MPRPRCRCPRERQDVIHYTARADLQLLAISGEAPSQSERIFAVVELAERFAREGGSPMGRPVQSRPGVRRLIAGSYHVFVRHDDEARDLLVLDVRHMRRRSTH